VGIFDNSFEEQISGFVSKFKTAEEFESKLVELVNEIEQISNDKNHRHHKALREWRVRLFNNEGHFLYPHQQDAVRSCIQDIALNDEKLSGYCFMPTSGGKSYIIFTLASLGTTDFRIFNLIEAQRPGYFNSNPNLFPFWISVNLSYARQFTSNNVTKTQILVHDIEILKQLQDEGIKMLGKDLASKIQFTSVQSHGNEARRENLKYVIIDECHWGNATQEETVQSGLVDYVKAVGGRAFGFTASPYENPAGKFQRTWSKNKINSDRDFNYYLENNVIYPIKLKEVNLQNARVDYEIGDEEVELTEKSQVVEFIASNILTTVPQGGLKGPAICFFSPVIIPDIVGELLEKDQYNQLKKFIKAHVTKPSATTNMTS
jgi:superfamily II DNA or RNA helicase